MNLSIEIDDSERRAVAASNGRAGLATDGEMLVEFWLALAPVRKEMISDLMRIGDGATTEAKTDIQRETAQTPRSSWADELTSGSW